MSTAIAIITQKGYVTPILTQQAFEALQAQASQFPTITASNKAQAEELVKKLTRLNKDIEAHRQEHFARPLQTLLSDAMRAEKAVAALTDPLKKRLTDFVRAEAQRVAAEKKRIEDEAAAKLQRHLDAINQAPGLSAEEKEIKALEAATDIELAAQAQTQSLAPVTGIRTSWDFKILDWEKIPREYFILDPTKVREAIKNGVRDIPGLEICSTVTLSGR